MAERVLQMRQQLGITGKALWTPLETIGQAELGLGHPAKAIEIFRRALQLPWGSGSRQVPELQFDLARALWESGRREEALALATRARAATAATALPGAVLPAVREMDEWLAARRPRAE
jgi:hypothetical protein